VHVSFRGFVVLFFCQGVVLSDPSGPHEQDIADLDVSALACGQDIDPLVFCAI
jgi:hypothetical protein